MSVPIVSCAGGRDRVRPPRPPAASPMQRSRVLPLSRPRPLLVALAAAVAVAGACKPPAPKTAPAPAARPGRPTATTGAPSAGAPSSGAPGAGAPTGGGANPNMAAILAGMGGPGGDPSPRPYF